MSPALAPGCRVAAAKPRSERVAANSVAFSAASSPSPSSARTLRPLLLPRRNAPRRRLRRSTPNHLQPWCRSPTSEARARWSRGAQPPERAGRAPVLWASPRSKSTSRPWSPPSLKGRVHRERTDLRDRATADRLGQPREVRPPGGFGSPEPLSLRQNSVGIYFLFEAGIESVSSGLSVLPAIDSGMEGRCCAQRCR